jgi:hypothetical protein
MPDEFDDVDLRPPRTEEPLELIGPDEPEPRRPDEPRGRRLLFPAMLAVVALIAVGILAALYFVFRHPATPKATPRPAASAPTAAARPGPTPAVPLPPLDGSDGFVRETAAGLSAHPEIARWLGRTALVRTLTAVVVNVSDGETPRPHLEFLAPKQRFRAAQRPGRVIVADPAGFAGYDAFADAVASVDANAAASAYRMLAPLFEAAVVELGHPEGGFPAALDRAIRALLAVPVLRADVELVPHATGFRYADPKLEGLTPAQKQFLRIGPRNVRIVQAKLREVADALAAPLSATPTP